MTAGLVYYRNSDESFTLSREESQATETKVVPWEDAQAYCEILVGGQVTLFGNLGFRFPAKHPFLGLYVISATATPVGNWNADASDWQDARISIDYGMMPLGGTGDSTLGEITFEVTTEEIVLPVKDFLIGGVAVEEGTNIHPVYRHPQVNISITFPFRPILSAATFQTLSGKVNATPLTIAAGLTYDAETVMYQNPRVSRTISSNGVDQYAVAYLFVVQPNGWNNQLNPKNMEWESFTTATGEKMYKTADLSVILANQPLYDN